MAGACDETPSFKQEFKLGSPCPSQPQQSNAGVDAKEQWERERSRTIEELAAARQKNVLFEQELHMAATEAILAQDALEYCVARAQTELAAGEGEELPASQLSPTSRPAAAAQGDAEALAEALVAAEMALDIALVERGGVPCVGSLWGTSANGEVAARVEDHTQSDDDVGKLRSELAEATAENRRLTETLASSSSKPTVTLVEVDNSILHAQVEELEERVAASDEALASMQSQSAVLRMEMTQRDAEWSARIRVADAEVAQLRRGLADAWAENAVQADEFVDSLAKVQIELSQLEAGAKSETASAAKRTESTAAAAEAPVEELGPGP